MEQSYKYTDVFLTHTWRPDLHGRNNHDRVRLVNTQLNRLGFTSWFDENKMEGEIQAKMSEGIDFTDCVIVFVTEQYMAKINSEHYDNCRYEFERAMTQKTEKNMLCIVMEEKFNNPANWFGKLKESLGNCLFVSMSGDLNDDVYLKKQLDIVVDQLKSKGVTPSQMRKKCIECALVNKNNERKTLFIDGDYCTHCASALQKTAEPKTFCMSCNTHENGEYCSTCRTHLLDKETKIREISEQCIDALTLDFSADLKRFSTLEVEEAIYQFKKELQDLNKKREEAQSKSIDLQLDDNEYTSRMKTLEENLDALSKNANTLTTSAGKCSKLLKPAYENELKILQDVMNSLSEKRKEINQCTGDVSRAADDLQRVRKQILDMKNDAIQGKDHLVHDKSCNCDDCVFERHLSSKMMEDGPRYLKSLVKENKIQELKKAIELRKEILEMENGDGFNLLLSYAVTHGSVDMCKMLIEAGVSAYGINSLGETLLHHVKDANVANMLCKRFGNKLLAIKDSKGCTPFMKAYMNNDLPLLGMLKKHVRSPLEEMDACGNITK